MRSPRSPQPRNRQRHNFLLRFLMQWPQIRFLSCQGYFPQAWKSHHTLRLLSQMPAQFRRQFPARSRYDHLPENLSVTHSQSLSCIDQVHIHLFKGSPGVAVHQWECDHCCRDHTSLPGLHHLKIKAVHQKFTEWPPKTEDQQEEKSCNSRRKNQRHSENAVQNRS